MKKLYLLSCLCVFQALTLMANSGIWRGSIDIDLNGSITTYYTGDNIAGNGHIAHGSQSLGTISGASSFLLKDPYLFSWKNNSCDVYDGRMYYRVYKQGSSPGAYTTVDFDFTCNCFTGCWRTGEATCNNSTDQEWGNSGANINLLAAALAADGSAGTYVLEIYFETNVQSGDCGTSTRSTAPITATFEAPVSLPVELIDFTARKRENQALLDWETATERDHDRFEIWRKSEQTNWVKIGEKISRDGNANYAQRYEFIDMNPEKGINYYRLGIVDINDKTTYSRVKTVSFSTLSVLIISPNPVKAGESVSLKQPTDWSLVRLFNMQGKLVKQWNNTGDESATIDLDLSAVESGVYFISVDNQAPVKLVRL